MLVSLPASDIAATDGVPLPRSGEILLVARWPVGGIRMHLGYNYPTLRSCGHRCTIVVPQGEDADVLQRTLPDAQIIGVPTQNKSCPLWSTVRSCVRSHRFRVVHAHGLTAAAHATLGCFGQRVPVVVTMHEPLRRDQFRGVFGSLERWLLSRALARAAAVITVSEDARANLLTFFPNLRRIADRIHTIPNGINTTKITLPGGPPSEDLRERLGIDDDVTLIGYLGRFMPEKGFPQLIEAVSRLARFGSARPFHVVAFGSSDYRAVYEKQIVERGLSGFLTLRDFVPDVTPVLERLDLVVVPSLWEASSLVSMEAMSAGVPVIGSDCPGLREVLRGTPSRMVRTGDVGALEVGLRGALADLWTDAARAYAPVACQRFDVRQSARRLVDLYERLGRPVAPANSNP
jgi:glycosyltransferase involved in cell wall biosynthesis